MANYHWLWFDECKPLPIQIPRLITTILHNHLTSFARENLLLNYLFLKCFSHCVFVSAAIDCQPLTAPANGIVNLSGWTPSSLATYSCNRGLSLVGQAIRVCMEGGLWSGMEPVCSKKLTIHP